MRFERSTRREKGVSSRGSLVALIAVALIIPFAAFARESSGASSASGFAFETSEPIVERTHEIRSGGRSLRYTSRAGRLPILDDQTGHVRAWIYFSAYVVQRTAREPARPLTFMWNGGPGANSALTHLAGLGPRRIVVPDNPPLGGPGNEKIATVDNPDTWLWKSDLVFVDPVGTGFSRATSADIESEFFGVRGDAESMAEFIRVYRNRYKAWDQPLVQGGESYGVTRAAWVAEALLRRKVPLSGVVLITWDIPLGDMAETERHALSLPTFTAAAFYHKRLAPELLANFDQTLSEVTDWSQGEYLDAVIHRDKLPAEQRTAVIAKLARYTGLDARQIDTRTLLIPTGIYSEQLMKDRQLALGRYDSRFVVSSVPPLPASGHRIYMDVPEPELVERYLREELGVNTDLQYTGEADAYWPGPARVRRDIDDQWDERLVAGEQPLEAAFQMNPALKVFSICGYYDLGANCIGDRYVINKAGEDIARNVTLRFYKGGHAPYFVAEVRSQLLDDFAAFIAALPK